MKYEYKILLLTEKNEEEELNKLGEQGWELIAINPSLLEKNKAYLKRKL